MRKVTKLTEFVSKSNKGWGERDYLCIRKGKDRQNPKAPTRPPRGEEKESEKGRVKSEKLSILTNPKNP
jgi:hypothetical protein